MDISHLRQDLHKLPDRVKTAETRLSTVEDALPPLQTRADHMQQQIQQLFSKQDEMENRLRRCNLRLIGLPEGAEGKDPAVFLEQLLITSYGREAFSPMLAVERAHCMPTKPPPQGAPPCTFIAKMLNFKDRDAALRMARMKGNIAFGNVRVEYSRIFQRWSSAGIRDFMEAKRRLMIHNYKYAMLFPAWLHVEQDGRASFFEVPEDAIAWLERRAPLGWWRLRS